MNIKRFKTPNMFLILRTIAENADFKDLVVLLDEFLEKRDGEDYSFY
jgi:hypothetical protein